MPTIKMAGKHEAPENFRDLLKLFRFYRDETGLPGLFANVDLVDVLPRQVYYAVHGRPPESIDTSLGDQFFTITEIFSAAIRSDEFRRNLIRNVLAAYPEKHRILFVHVPKCAGANLSAHLIGRFASLNTNIIDQEVVSDEEMFLALKHISLELEVSETIFVHGHVHLYQVSEALTL